MGGALRARLISQPHTARHPVVDRSLPLADDRLICADHDVEEAATR
jgi:hypothetical protein